MTKAYHKLVTLFKQNLEKAQTSQSHGPNAAASVTAVMQDLLVLVLPHLSAADATALFNLCLTSDVLENKDNGVQKRGYKILAKLAESGKVTVDVESVLKGLEGNVDGLAPAAKKVALCFRSYSRTMLKRCTGSLPFAQSVGTSDPSGTSALDTFDNSRGGVGHQGTF